MSFNSSGITYRQIEPKNGLSFSGFNGTRGPHSLTKVERECKSPPLVPVQVSKPVTPIIANPVCVAIVNNVVASLSCMTLEDIPATVPLVEHISTPTIEECAQYEQCIKNRRARTRKAKKAKKAAVHPAPVDPSARSIRVFPEVPVSEHAHAQLYAHYELTHKPQMNFSNPTDEYGKHLFVQPVLNHNNPHARNEVNPHHFRAPFYRMLMGYMDQMEADTAVDPYFDDVTDCPDDVSSGSEDEVSSPVRHWRMMTEISMDTPSEIYHYRWEDNLNNELFHDMGPNGCGYTRYKYPYSSTANIDSHQLLAAIDSVVSSVENNIHVSHAINCVKCAQSKSSHTIEILADSGASLNFTNQRSDLCKYEEIEIESVEMASAHFLTSCWKRSDVHFHFYT